MRTIKPAAMSTRTARKSLTRGRQPHWNALAARAHLGYQRWPDEKAGRWILRRRIAGRYSMMTIAAADDAIASDGVGTLTYDEARERALELSQSERVAGSPTVARVFEDYLRDLRARGRTTEVARTAARYILPELGDVPVADLTTGQLQNWLSSVATVSVRHGKPVGDGEEARRRRMNSANRIATALIAALNFARRRKQASSDAAWRDLKKFEGVDVPRTRYLSIAESVRLLNACDPDFRNLVRAALETGCRFGELARLEVVDFNPDVGTIAVRKSKTNRARHVVLTDEGAAFFRSLCIGRSGDERMLSCADGEWRHTRQARPMAAAVARAKIAPQISFHGLRHTYASLSVMNGVPLMVLARNLGHTTTRMVEKHYGHLSDDYVAAEIRRGAPVFGSEPTLNVESLNRRKLRKN
jgi:integrase